MIVSYRAMMHCNDAQCRPVRLEQYVNQDPRLIFKTRLVFKARPLLLSTTTLDPRPVFEARLVFKSRLLFEEIRYVEKLLHGRSRVFLGDRLSRSSAVGEMGDRGHNGHGPKGGRVAPYAGGAGSPSNTMWPGLRSPSVPSGIFIHIAV